MSARCCLRGARAQRRVTESERYARRFFVVVTLFHAARYHTYAAVVMPQTDIAE